MSKLEGLIRSEVPTGSDRLTIEKWFDQYGIQHQYFSDTRGAMDAGRTMPQLAGLKSEELSGMVSGLIKGPNANVHPIFHGEISVYFFLDMKGRYVGHLVHTLTYTP